MTQSEAVKAAGIGRSSLSQIENGAIQEIGIRQVIRVLDFLGLELTTRLRGAPPTLEELREEKAPGRCISLASPIAGFRKASSEKFLTR